MGKSTNYTRVGTEMLAILCAIVALAFVLILPVALLINGGCRAIASAVAPAPQSAQSAVYHIRVAGEHPMPDILKPKEVKTPNKAHPELEVIGITGIQDWTNGRK